MSLIQAYLIPQSQISLKKGSSMSKSIAASGASPLMPCLEDMKLLNALKQMQLLKDSSCGNNQVTSNSTFLLDILDLIDEEGSATFARKGTGNVKALCLKVNEKVDENFLIFLETTVCLETIHWCFSIAYDYFVDLNLAAAGLQIKARASMKSPLFPYQASF